MAQPMAERFDFFSQQRRSVASKDGKDCDKMMMLLLESRTLFERRAKRGSDSPNIF